MYALAVSNSIQIVKHPCNTMVIRYRDEANAYGYSYQEFPAFYQQIRLGIDVRNFKFPISKSIYTQADGKDRNNNVVIRKTRELFTDPMDEETLEELNAALNHSEVYINDQGYSLHDTIEIEPVDAIGNLANGKATLYLQNYQKTNISCT